MTTNRFNGAIHTVYLDIAIVAYATKYVAPARNLWFNKVCLENILSYLISK